MSDPPLGGQPDYLIVGGGTAGCVLASRLSEDPARRVLLVEAGSDHHEPRPTDLSDTDGGRAFMDPRHFWPDLHVTYAAHRGKTADNRAGSPYKQGRLLGGGSAINGQIALRGAPDDYDGWKCAGAAGWGWADVLPTFRKLETDLDFATEWHGREGPLAIRRHGPDEWDAMTAAVARAWTALGARHLPDLNGAFEDGYGPVPLSNDGTLRHSTSHAYLTPQVRRRPNLTILTRTRALRVRTENGRAVGIDAVRDGATIALAAHRVILSAGALRSPHLLMLSGIGDGTALARHGLPTVSHRPGVGRNLQDHPITSISAYTVPGGRTNRPLRAVLAYRRYSSGTPGCDPSDMVMSAGARSMWHAVGERIFSLRSYLALPYATGTVGLRAPDPLMPPAVDFNALGDERDLRRMVDGFRQVAAILLALQPRMISDVFPSRLSRLIENLSRPTRRNGGLARLGATIMDRSPGLRSFLIERLLTDGVALADILGSDRATEEHVLATVGTSWHPSGTCRMGSPDGLTSVVDPGGAVIGVAQLFVADASIMPRITRTNTNLPTVMLAERLSKLIPAHL